MLETIREFAREQLEAAGGGEAELTRMLHAEHFLALAEEADPHLTGPEQARWLDRLETEHDNLRAALSWFREAGEIARGARLAVALRRFWQVRGYLTEGRDRLAELLATGAEVPDGLRVRALDACGVLAWSQGDYVGANALLDEAYSGFARDSDRPGMARILSRMGLVATDQGDLDLAEHRFRESLLVAEEMKDARERLTQLANLGMVSFLRTQFDRATDYYEKALQLAPRVGDQQITAIQVVNLAEAREFQGDIERATGLYEQALERFRALGDKQRTVFAMGGMARIALRKSNCGVAGLLIREGLELAQGIGDRAAIASLAETTAAVLAALGRSEQAVSVLGAAQRLRELIGAPLADAYRGSVSDLMLTTRAQLGESCWRDAWSTGTTWSVDDAVSHALHFLPASPVHDPSRNPTA